MRNERFIVNELIKDDRGLVGWKLFRKNDEGDKEEVIMYTEELIAQLLKYGRKLSEI